jgi:flagellar hook assembly protein FlgD
MRYHINEGADVTINVLDVNGKVVDQIMSAYRPSGDHELTWTPKQGISAGAYTAQLSIDGVPAHTLKITVTK